MGARTSQRPGHIYYESKGRHLVARLWNYVYKEPGLQDWFPQITKHLLDKERNAHNCGLIHPRFNIRV